MLSPSRNGVRLLFLAVGLHAFDSRKERSAELF